VKEGRKRRRGDEPYGRLFRTCPIRAANDPHIEKRKRNCVAAGKGKRKKEGAEARPTRSKRGTARRKGEERDHFLGAIPLKRKSAYLGGRKECTLLHFRKLFFYAREECGRPVIGRRKKRREDL